MNFKIKELQIENELLRKLNESLEVQINNFKQLYIKDRKDFVDLQAKENKLYYEYDKMHTRVLECESENKKMKCRQDMDSECIKLLIERIEDLREKLKCQS